MFRRVSLIALASIIIFTGCTKLEEEIYDKIPEDQFPENAAQASQAIIPAYQELSDLVDDAGWWFWMQETTSDEICFPVRETDWNDGGKWRVLHQHMWDNNTEGVNSMWSHMYDGVFEANQAIDELLPFAEEQAAQVTLAKLKTLRAFYYYLLVDNYGDVPLVTSFFDAPALPQKTPRAEIVDFLIEELEAAIPLLPEFTNKFAVSSGMARTLLAKIYLNSEVYTDVPRYDLADAQLDTLIDNGVYFLDGDFSGPFKSQNTASGENIFTIPFDELDLKGFRLHMRTLHYRHQETFDMAVEPWNGFCILEDHFNSYDDEDPRKEAWFLVGPQFSSGGQPLVDEVAQEEVVIDPNVPALVMDATFSKAEIRMSGARVQKYEIPAGAQENLSNDFPVFRFADVLLMKAETAVRLSGPGAGDSFINQVRTRATMPSLAGATLEDILEERGRELFCEGHRRQDLIRFGQFNQPWWEKGASTPDRNIFPIPQWAIDANPNLQ